MVAPIPAAAPPPADPSMMTPMEPPDPMEEGLRLLQEMMNADDGTLKDILAELSSREIKAIKELAKAGAESIPELDDLVERIDMLLGALAHPGPRYPDDYPPGFTKPKKPTLAVVDDLAHSDQAEYVDYRTRVQKTREWLMMKRMGKFSKWNKRRDEPFRSPTLHNEFQMRSAIIGRADLNIEMPVLHAALRQEAQECEDFGYWAWERIKEQHVERLNGPLQIDMAKYAISSGIVVFRCLMNPINGKFPWKIELLDPTTVFPVPGGEQGLLRVTRVYTTSLIKALDAFDRDGKLAGKLLAKDKETGRAPAMSDDVEVIEYYDRWWMMVVVGGHVAISGEHKYGYVPFVIQVNGHGMPLSSVNLVNANTAISQDEGSVETANWFHWAAGDLDAQVVNHAMMEAMMGKYAAGLRRSDNPPWKRKVSPLAKDKGGQPRELTDGAVNPELLNEEEWEPLLVGPPPQLAQPFLAALQQGLLTGGLPETMYGAGQPNQSGNAISGLNTGGQNQMYPSITTCELAVQRLLRMMLRQMADWGDLLGEEGQRGKLVVPYQPMRRDVNEVSFELTAETVKAVGTDLMVELRADELQDLLPKINAANLGIQAELFSRRFGRDLLGIRDPHAMEGEIIEENAVMDQRVRDMYVYATLLKRAGLIDEIPPEIWPMIWKDQFMGQQQQGQGGTPGQGGAPAPGVNTSAVNMQALGQGQQGPTGRPPLPPGPMGGPAPPPPGSVTLPPGTPIPGMG
ncbi:MAG TPA: hypothetical protein VLA89_15885 [Gemmatimonadales bacterium]|nr:hypothetical protein [Gemmatimonadales bacterium]